MKAMAVIPTYNEAENIEALLKEVLSVYPGLHAVVVDDSSPDGTGDIVRDLAEREPRIHLIVRTQERGRGTAGVAGFRYALAAGAPRVIEMDGDGSHDPRFIPSMMEAFETSDVVVGSRETHGGAIVGRSPLRNIITKCANAYIRFVLKLPVRDCTTGFRAFRREVLEAIDLDGLISTGPSIVEEVLYACHLGGARIVEVPIVFTDRTRGASTLTVGKLFDTFLKILQFRRTMRP